MIVYLKADGSVKKIYPDTLTQGSSTGSIVLIAEGVSNYSTISATAKLPVSGQVVEVGIMTPISAYTLDNEVVYAYYVNLTDSLTNFAGNLQLTFSVTNSGKTNSYIVTWAINPTLEPTLPTAPDTDWYDNIKEAFAYLTGKINTDIPQDIADAVTNHNNSQEAHPYLLGLISALTNSVPQQIETHNTSSTAHQDIRSDIQTNTDDISAILNNSKIIKNANGGFVAGDVDDTSNKSDNVRIGHNLQSSSGVQIGSKILSRIGIGKNVTDNGGGYAGVGVGDTITLKGGVGVGTNISGEYNGVYLGNDLHDGSNSYQPSIMIGSKIKTNVNGAKGTITLNNGSKQVENKEDGSFQVNQYNILTKDGKLRTNIGTADNPQMVEVLTQAETGVYKYKGSVQTYADLPTENNQAGDVWNVIEKYESYPAGTNFAWTPDGTWDALGGTIEVDVGEPIAEAIRDNTTLIKDSAGGFSAGNVDTKTRLGSIAIGNSAASYNSIDNIAIGRNANSIGLQTIQLGEGTNNSSTTLQVGSDPIYNWGTHTARFQNLKLDGIDEYPTLSGADAPTTTTVGKVKQFYVETTTPALYYCSSITGTGTTEDPYVYNWTQAGGGIDALSGTTAPTSSTIGKLGQIYIDTAKNCSYVCIQTNNTTYSLWINIGGGGSGLGRGNGNCYMSGSATDVGHSSVNINGIGTASSNYCVNIGYLSGASSNINSSTAVGYQATYSANDTLALGYYASANANKSIQIGQGTNTTENSLQIFKDNIYNHSTHTLTVQNIELNGVDLGTLLGDINTALETILGV